MSRSIACYSLLLLVVIAASACTDRFSDSVAVGKGNTPPTDSWLQGTLDERFETVAAQLGGFGVTMVEVGYRYGELHFAGQDQNWEYAAYQIEEMEAAIEFGLQRRPGRAGTAAMLTPALDEVKVALATRDQDAFNRAFITLTGSCNACHVAEGASFVRVAPPEHRTSPVRAHQQASD